MLEPDDLSVIIAARCHTSADLDQLARTVQSIGPGPEIIIVDDHSPEIIFADVLNAGNVTIRRNHTRQGCAPSRQLGATFSNRRWFLFTDAHMDFPPGWFNTWAALAQQYPANVLWTGHFKQAGKPDIYGANFYFRKDFPNGKAGFCDLDPLPAPGLESSSRLPESWEVPCCIGACYFVSTSMFWRLNGLAGLRYYGSDEMCLSLKWWLAGGSVRVLRDLGPAHLGDNRPPREVINPIDRRWLLFNKLYLIETLFPQKIVADIYKLLPADPAIADARLEISSVRKTINLVAMLLRDEFTRSPDWLFAHLLIEPPADTLLMGRAAALA